jgi:rubrerythrin
METEWWAECEACGTDTQVLVLDEEEAPQHCPMCGSSVEYEELED